MTAVNVKQKLRCAIYTRKSTEEGLEQEFNSLHAQREACEAYIKSQAHEGWMLVKTAYDDGGFSGGSIQRPALKQLMDDVQLGQVNVIVVYKVDRLTRSLADFAKIVEILDCAKASFVSVTQSFNTTTSMGRLTLNVLLSFAQFEREVTGERIRDKIAASKRKGMWMGGNPPFGYDIVDRKLVINTAEAEHIRYIFQRYLETGTALAVLRDLDAKGILSKAWTSTAGRKYGGVRIGTGPLYHILSNRTYIGQINHKGAAYDGEHQPIIDRALFELVQARLIENKVPAAGSVRVPSQAILAGLLYDDRGNLMSPTHAQKKDGRRYPYYVSRALQGRKEEAGSIARISARAIEALVVEQVKTRVADPEVFAGLVASGGASDALHDRLSRVVLRPHEVEIVLRGKAGNGDDVGERTICIPTRLTARRGSVTILAADAAGSDAPRANSGLIRTVVRAHQWRRLIESGQANSVDEVARINKCTTSYARFMLEVSFLSPVIVDDILDGKATTALTVRRLFERGIRESWKDQIKELRTP